MAKPPWTAWGSPELLHLDELGTRDRSDNELCNPLIRVDGDGMLTKIDQDDFDLAAIISVNRTRRIHERQPFVECSATSGPHLPLEARRYFNRHSSGNGSTLERYKHQILVEGCSQIYARGVLALITWDGTTHALNFDDWDNHSFVLQAASIFSPAIRLI